MGNCYLYGTPPDYDKALEYFNKTLLIDSAFSNKKQMSDSYINLGSGSVHRVNSKPPFPTSRDPSFSPKSQDTYRVNSRHCRPLPPPTKARGEPNAAYQTLQLSIRTKDSLVNVNSEAKIAELQTVYETEKKQQQINLQQAEISKKNFIITSIVLLTIMLALLGFSGYRRYKLLEKARLQSTIINQQELATRAVIKAEEDERQRIARDLHDGVGQMMSAAKMNLSCLRIAHILRFP